MSKSDPPAAARRPSRRRNRSRRARRATDSPRPAADLRELVSQALERQPRALGRALTLLENRGSEQRQLITEIYPRTGKARVVGLTGPPGAGKSTLVGRLAQLCRRREETVGILAIDPTSPYTGGALLGDRVRMQPLYTDAGAFIRSMATRGAMGGLAPATRDAVDLLDAAGFEWIFVETVGVGQDEVDIVRTVDTVVVATVPGLGDEIQAIKAGIMEIADIFVVNKADREGADRTVRDLRSMLEMVAAPSTAGWVAPVLKTIGPRDQGLGELWQEIERHQEWLQTTGALERRRFAHLGIRVETILKERMLSAARHVADLEEQVERAFHEREDPYRLADRLFTSVLEIESARREE
jgi:LAO/AO transport system kinase